MNKSSNVFKVYILRWELSYLACLMCFPLKTDSNLWWQQNKMRDEGVLTYLKREKKKFFY